ncbi:replicative DNA helicase [Clostridium butyricum]|uniref:replicative DNA helicase n=1 Tax=Clostridium butyricum TaxID=1492 RepID=UPI00374F9EF7
MNDLIALPQSIDAEQTLLGCILNSTDEFIKVDGIVNENDFYIDKHKKIYSTIKKLINQNRAVDQVTVIEELNSNDLLQNCGGVTYISELATGAINYSNLDSYAEIVKEKSNRRKLIKTGQEIMVKAFDGDINKVVEDVENDLYTIVSNDSKDIMSIDDAIELTFQSLEKRCLAKGLQGITTGFDEIDRLSSGLNRKDFIVLAARPSMGKTAFALNIGQAASEKGNVAIFSLEMSTEQLMNRLLSARCLVDFYKITNGLLDDEEFLKIGEGVNELSRRKLFIDDESSMLNDIKAKCRKLKIQKGLDVVIIDYLQLIRTSIKVGSREQEVSHISRELKALAKELDITVIALSQLSRAPEMRADHRPMLSDLRESGSIEQDADIIHFLYRDEYYNKETEDRNIAEVITAKNRNGVTTTTKLVWLGQYQRFGSLDVIRE